MVGLAPRPVFLETRYTLGIFSDDFATALEEYKRFVQDGLEKPDCIDTDVAMLGKPPVNESVASLLRCKRNSRGIARAQKYADRLPLQEILRSFRNKRERDSLILYAYNESGYSMKHIADHLGVKSSTVSRVIKAARDACGTSQ